MSKMLEKTNHAREINLFCVTDVFYCDFVSSEPTRIQNRVHVNKTGDVHFVYARKRRFLRYFFEKRIQSVPTYSGFFVHCITDFGQF